MTILQIDDATKQGRWQQKKKKASVIDSWKCTQYFELVQSNLSLGYKMTIFGINIIAHL